MKAIDTSKRQIIASCFMTKSGKLKVVRYDTYKRYESIFRKSSKCSF